MNREIKKAYSRITISEAAENSILKLFQEKPEHNHRIYQLHMKRLALALTALLIFVPAITVFASSDFFLNTFGRLFGQSAEVVRDNASIPEVNVISNTFDDLDIEINGIAGDDHVIYIVMDITKKDGSTLNLNYYRFLGGISLETYPYAAGNYPDNSTYSVGDAGTPETTPDVFTICGTNHWVMIPDEDPADNKVSLAYIADMVIQDHGKSLIFPGQTYFLRLTDFFGNTMDDYWTDVVVSSGTLEAKFTVDYDPADSISLGLSETARFPEWKTSDRFVYATDIQNITLSPLTLRFTAEFDYSKDFWDCIYIEMQDGSHVGFKTYEEYMASFTDNQDYMLSGVNNVYTWIFNEPIDINEVKSVHFGDLEIKIPHGE